MTAQPLAREFGRDIRIIVPGTWVDIPVDDPARSVAFVKRLVRQQVGPADRLARVRREAVQELVMTARQAAEAGVHTYLMSLELAPSVPFPAAIMMYDAEWPESARQLADEGDIEGALRAIPDGEVATQKYGPVARVAEMAQGKTSEDGIEILTMRLVYYMPYPDEQSKLLVIRVNVPNIPSAEPFAMLFDEIVDSITFLDADEPE
ncbi:hypothetical protein GCM10027063_45520 [Promicromonospora xylanilytica]